ncbi:MAG: nuclear transport factor 2 family protein [Elusimicrobia bacterium]|nr:nuclear transport factor 2 family protein [Elusimicrobiota bacterium]
MYPGEGLKTVVSATGAVVKKTLDSDCCLALGAKAALGAIDPDRWAARFDKFDMSLGGSVYHNAVSGDRSRSFLKKGWRTQETLTLAATKRLTGLAGGEFDFQTSMRNTDDRQVDNERHMRLQGFSMGLKRPDDFELRAGNVSGNFSSYSLSAGAELGLQGTKKFGAEGKAGEALFYYGVPTQHVGNKQFDRHVMGARVAGLKGGAFFDGVGLSLVRTKDDAASIDNPAVRPANAVDSQVVAADGKFKLGKAATLNTELAFSRTDADTQSGAASFKHGTAFKADGSYKAPDALGLSAPSLTASFEQVAPDYVSASGGGSADGRRLGGGVSSALGLPGRGPRVTLSYSGNTSRNNLEGRLARTNSSTVHSANVGVKPFEKAVAGEGFAASLAKNLSLGTAFGHNTSDTSDDSSGSTVRSRNFTLGTSAGKQTLSTFVNYQKTEERTAATGDRESRGLGANYVLAGIPWGFPKAKPVSSDLAVNLTQTRDRTLDAAGGSLQRAMKIGAQTKVNDDETLALDYELAFTGNDTANSDVRNENWKVAYAISKFIKEEGTFAVSYTSKRTMEAVSTRNYREEVWRGDLALKWGGGKPSAPGEAPVTTEEARAAVVQILEAFDGAEPSKFLAFVSPAFKDDRAAFEQQVRAEFDKVDAVKYETVSVLSFIADGDILEVTFVWQRRRRVYATGAEETVTGIAVFRLDKVGGKRMLQEIRRTNPLF